VVYTANPTYGCELYPNPSEQQQRLAAEIQRWVAGAYRGSNKAKVEWDTVLDLQMVLYNKRISWAASVYGRQLPELRQMAEEILRSVLEEDSQLEWMHGKRRGGMKMRVEELDAEVVEEWTDGSRMEGRAARGGCDRRVGSPHGWEAVYGVTRTLKRGKDVLATGMMTQPIRASASQDDRSPLVHIQSCGRH